jgi:ribosomal protein S21
MYVFVRESNVLVALRKLKKKLEKEGVLVEMKKRVYAMRPGEKRRAKHRRAIIRAQKASARN